MARRIESTTDTEVYIAVQHLQKAIAAGGVPPALLSLVHLRASQINGCAPCVFASTTSAKRAGETDERLHNLVAWREAPFYDDGERAALALAEGATRLQDGAVGVTDEVWDRAAAHFTAPQLESIVLEVALTSFFNRVNRAVNEPAGKTWA
jgi:AhpD family alkylhydroperoxidase